MDVARVYVPAVQAAMLKTPLGAILRDSEKRTPWREHLIGLAAGDLSTHDDASSLSPPLLPHPHAPPAEQLTGACFFSLGLCLVICLFPPSLAMTSTLHLVLGDMMAALIGVSFGGDVCVVKLGRSGKKSVEGSAAMFVTCFLVTISVGWLVGRSRLATPRRANN